MVLETSILLILFIILLRYIGIVPGIILTSFGKQIIRARAVVISIISSVILNFILIPTYGINGAFLASLIAHIILNLFYVYYAHKTIFFTKNISIFLLISIFSINYMFLLIFSSDTMTFFGITVILNALLTGIYFIIKSKKNKFQK